MSQFAIPGLMTSPRTPKADRRFTADREGHFRAVLWRDTRANADVGYRVMQAYEGNRYREIRKDLPGLSLIRLKNPTGWDYVWRQDALSSPLPEGFFEIWVYSPGDARETFYVTVPRIDIVESEAEVIVAPDVESGFGLVAVPTGVQTFRADYGKVFTRLPTSVLVSLVAPRNLDTIEVVTVNTSGHDNSGFVVALSAPITIDGYQISWSAKTAVTVPSQALQDGQFLISAGTSIQTVPFPLAFDSDPVPTGSVQSASNGETVVLSFVITNVEKTQFKVVFSSPTAQDYLFNWQAQSE